MHVTQSWRALKWLNFPESLFVNCSAPWMQHKKFFVVDTLLKNYCKPWKHGKSVNPTCTLSYSLINLPRTPHMIYCRKEERKKERYICGKAHMIHDPISFLIHLEPSHATMSAPKCFVHSQTPQIVIFHVWGAVRSGLIIPFQVHCMQMKNAPGHQRWESETSSPGASAPPPRSRRSRRGSSYQRSRGTCYLVQPWLARLRLVNCLLAKTYLCCEDPLWLLERQQLPSDKQPASQGQRWGCISETLTSCAYFWPYFVPLFVLNITSVKSIKEC